MDCLERHAAVRDALELDIGALQRGADHIVALLDSVELALAVDMAAIREAQGNRQPHGSPCPIAELIGWGDRIAAVQARLQDGRDLVVRLRSENLALRQELARDLR